jgi:uncharacterized membrane protein YqgA involved in biofilm formation
MEVPFAHNEPISNPSHSYSFQQWTRFLMQKWRAKAVLQLIVSTSTVGILSMLLCREIKLHIAESGLDPRQISSLHDAEVVPQSWGWKTMMSVKLGLIVALHLHILSYHVNIFLIGHDLKKSCRNYVNAQTNVFRGITIYGSSVSVSKILKIRILHALPCRLICMITVPIVDNLSPSPPTPCGASIKENGMVDCESKRNHLDPRDSLRRHMERGH